MGQAWAEAKESLQRAAIRDSGGETVKKVRRHSQNKPKSLGCL
jgi:hypothetical protein